MRFTLIALASVAALVAGCSKDPAPQVIQPGVPIGQVQPQIVQPQVAGEQYQQAQPAPVYVQPAPQQPIVVQPAPQHDNSTNALVTGMALGALLNNGGSNTTVYRDRVIQAPAPSYVQPAPSYYPRPAAVAPVQAPPQKNVINVKPNFVPPPPPAPAPRAVAPAPAPKPITRAAPPPPPPAKR